MKLTTCEGCGRNKAGGGHRFCRTCLLLVLYHKPATLEAALALEAEIKAIKAKERRENRQAAAHNCPNCRREGK